MRLERLVPKLVLETAERSTPIASAIDAKVIPRSLSFIFRASLA